MNSPSSDESINSSGISFSCDWSSYGMAQELMNTREQGLHEIKCLTEETNLNWSKKSNKYNKLKNKMKKSITELREAKKEFDDILNNYEQKLKPIMKNIKEKENELLQSNEILTDQIIQLKEEEGRRTAEQKLESEAIQRALHLFSNFDMNVNTKNISGDTITASITFGFSKDALPIEVVVDTRKRKIIDINFESSSSKSSYGDVSGPKFLCGLRETIMKNVL